MRGLIERARADLSPDAPEYRGAILLLCVQDVGMNVDRLVYRTKLPREFVAKCLRRLADNAFWLDGEMRMSWGEDPCSTSDFWLDVEVALGRGLRRINEEGRPEWAPIGGWVKDFNYRGARGAESAFSNDYYRIAPHDPDPDPPSEEVEEEPVKQAVESDGPTSRPTPPTPPESPAVNWLGSPDKPDSDAEGRKAPPSRRMLVETWSGADWLE